MKKILEITRGNEKERLRLLCGFLKGRNDHLGEWMGRLVLGGTEELRRGLEGEEKNKGIEILVGGIKLLEKNLLNAWVCAESALIDMKNFLVSSSPPPRSIFDERLPGSSSSS